MHMLDSMQVEYMLGANTWEEILNAASIPKHWFPELPEILRKRGNFFIKKEAA